MEAKLTAQIKKLVRSLPTLQCCATSKSQLFARVQHQEAKAAAARATAPTCTTQQVLPVASTKRQLDNKARQPTGFKPHPKSTKQRHHDTLPADGEEAKWFTLPVPHHTEHPSPDKVIKDSGAAKVPTAPAAMSKASTLGRHLLRHGGLTACVPGNTRGAVKQEKVDRIQEYNKPIRPSPTACHFSAPN